jgi:hypothetical protein
MVPLGKRQALINIMKEKIIGYVPGLASYATGKLEAYGAVVTTQRIILVKLYDGFGGFSAMKNANNELAAIQNMNLAELSASPHEKITVPKMHLQALALSEWPFLFKSKIQLRSETFKKTFKISKKQFLEFKRLYEALKSSLADTMEDLEKNPSGMPMPPVDQSAVTIKGPETIPGYEYSRKRYWSIAFVLILNSIIGLGSAVYLAKTGAGIDSLTASSISPWVIDIILAIMLFAKKDVLSWVLFRAVIGGFIWTGLDIANKDYLSAISQIIFCAYFVVLTHKSFNKVKFRIAMGLLAITVALFSVGFYQSITESAVMVNEINGISTRLEALSNVQRTLINTDTVNMSARQFQDHFGELRTVSIDREKVLQEFLSTIDKYNSKPMSEKDKGIMQASKDLVQAELDQNKHIVALSDLMVTIEPENVTLEQEERYNEIYDTIEEYDTRIEELKEKLETSME